MLEVLLYLKLYFDEKVFSIAYNEEISVDKRLERLSRKSEEQFLEGPGGCFIGMIGTETVISNPKFNSIIKEFFADWKRAFVHLYSQTGGSKIASELADQAIMLIEGAVLMVRIHNNPDYLTRVQRKLIQEFIEIKNDRTHITTRNK